MNIERITQLRDHLAQLHDSRFHISAWVEGGPEPDPNQLTATQIRHDCGTCACIGGWADALFQPQSRRAFRALKNLGLADAHEIGDEPAGTYTFWDYQAGAWQRDHGIRIDFALLSPQAADRLRGVEPESLRVGHAAPVLLHVRTHGAIMARLWPRSP